MLLLIIALFLIYNMTSVCGDGFNVGALSRDCPDWKTPDPSIPGGQGECYKVFPTWHIAY
jgi:hypothetical protein